LEADAAELQYGIDCKNPALVGHIARDKMYLNNNNENWLCVGCAYREPCVTMRREAGEFKNRVEELLTRL
jgi:hypothetical protein